MALGLIVIALIGCAALALTWWTSAFYGEILLIGNRPRAWEFEG
jgi:hypothetical protein